MDKRYTWGIRSHYRITLILLLLTSFSTFGQCDNDSITIVQTDSCEMVQMSPTKFTEFYLYKKNLDEIRIQIPNIEKTLDSLNAVNEKLQLNLEAEIDTSNHQKSLVVKSLDDCSKVLAKVDIENGYLTVRVGELERRQWKMFGYGATTGVVIVALLKILTQ